MSKEKSAEMASRIACGVLVLACWLSAGAAHADAPDKSGYSLFNPTPDAEMRGFSTDRPPKANSPYTVDAGHYQYETDLFVYSYGKAGGVENRDWTVFDPTLKAGLTNDIDAEFQITPYQQAKTKGAALASSISGWGDSYARVKVNLLGNDSGNWALALLPYIKIPTARAGLGNGSVEGGLILPIGVTMPGGFTVILMPETDCLKDRDNAGYHPALDFLINISHPLNDAWGIYGEIFTTQSLNDQDKPIYTIDSALTYAVTANLQLDFGGNYSLNSAAPQIQLYTGLSQRF